ncbi:MAG TPA: hypothetical protein EYP57_09330, partial [Thermodesulfobacteriaceae bacterium]|nr:hypothetical protein [Thermodesulfobacteriaceae bacterium]
MTRKENKKKISEKQSGPSIEALFTELTEIIARLRAPDGCPWDREQTPETVRKYILEETYELAEAIDGGRPEAVCEELGDTIFLLLFVAGIYEERHADFLRNALEGIAEKMIRRHPHIFGDLKVETSE